MSAWMVKATGAVSSALGTGAQKKAISVINNMESCLTDIRELERVSAKDLVHIKRALVTLTHFLADEYELISE